MIHFKKGILKILIPSKYDARTFKLHKKRSRLKTILSRYISIPAAIISEINIGKISLDKSDFSDSNIIFDEFSAKGDVVV